MGLKTNSNEIMIYCNPNADLSKKVIAYSNTIAQHVKVMDWEKSPLTALQINGLLDQLDMRPKDLMNRAHEYYQQNIRGREFNKEGWLNILVKNPYIIKAPIVIKGNRAILCDNYTKVLEFE